MLDIIIENGEIIDGTGKPAYKADIGIKDKKIVIIGDLQTKNSKQRINAKGKIVSPGFIDIHTHSDAVLLADGKADSQVCQGVTSEVVGQCGFSFAPVGDKERMGRWMIGKLPNVDITWGSFGEYLDKLEQQELGINIYAMVGHGALHGAVIDDATIASDSDYKKMEFLLEESLDEGAWGLSTGLEYWPGSGAATRDLERLCSIVSRYDRLHASHVRNRDIYYDLGFGEMIALGRVTGVRTQISHIQPKYGRPDYAMSHTLSMIDQALSIDVDVAFDVIPHEWSHTSVVACLPTWSRQGGVFELLKRLKRTDVRQQIRQDNAPMWRLILDHKWDRIVLYHCNANPELIGKTFDEISQIMNCDPFDAMFDLILAEGEHCEQMLWTALNFEASDINMCIKRPECGVMSDTMALCQHGPTKDIICSISGYGWAARFLTHYVRELKLITIEDAIRRITSLPAERIGIKDRGLIQAGKLADITVFDYEEITYNCTVISPQQHPKGFEYVLVNGELAIECGQRTSNQSGKVVRA